MIEILLFVWLKPIIAYNCSPSANAEPSDSLNHFGTIFYRRRKYMTQQFSFAQIILWLFVIALGIEIGAGLYETFVIVPLWAGSAPESAIAFYRHNANNPHLAINAGGRFWIFVTPLVSLLSIATLLSGWRTNPEHLRWRCFIRHRVHLCVVCAEHYFDAKQSSFDDEPGGIEKLGKLVGRFELGTSGFRNHRLVVCFTSLELSGEKCFWLNSLIPFPDKIRVSNWRKFQYATRIHFLQTIHNFIHTSKSFSSDSFRTKETCRNRKMFGCVDGQHHLHTHANDVGHKSYAESQQSRERYAKF
jgi:hypothetical protein